MCDPRDNGSKASYKRTVKALMNQLGFTKEQAIEKLKDYFDWTLEESISESTLTEKNWKYQLKTGKTLRDAIDKGNVEAVITALKMAWQEVHDIMPDEFDEYELDSKIEEIDMIDNDEDEVDYELGDFYDFCDSYDIWVSL